MTRELLRYFRGLQGGVCALILTFLVFPYLVDVAYYRDLSPSHSAQESVDNKNEVERFDTSESLLRADDLAYSGKARFRLQDVGTRCSSPATSVVPSHYLFVASHISRPPPTL